MAEKVIALRPLKLTTEEFDQLEARIKRLFREEIYFPLLREFSTPQTALRNADEDYGALVAALRSGRITFYRGVFSGRLSASISKELRALGASFNRRDGTYRLSLRELPMALRSSIAASGAQFEKKLSAIDTKLSQILPEEIAGQLKASDLFDRTIWKTQDAFEESVKGITIAPKLSPEAAKKLADEWENNLKLYIKDFTDEEILRLRASLKSLQFPAIDTAMP
jgi:hypothetical protein